MFVTDETINSRSQVTFYRCSLCVSEHVSSEPIIEPAHQGSTDYFASSSPDKNRYLMV